MSEMPTNEVGGESFTAYIERLGVTLAPTGNPNLSRELFEANDAQHFIDSFSVYQGDRLNIFTTAKQLGVSLRLWIDGRGNAYGANNWPSFNRGKPRLTD